MNMKKATGLALATAAAAIFAATAPMTASAGEAKVNCYNVNSCKGNGSCKTANNACKGQNSCKGTGFVAMNAEACKAIGGKEG